ncbi:glycerophosphodiester phosphodiesterase [Bacillus massiliglaciei]|uniref:glycerophosphodiester phosphodiesterase n=1 Tax=Bacillus massiliglaciei TaxID=1816693 RepID=UPI000A5E8994|nr:glycerophosphodiester phosphodiesterase [Bacillus massiliglaciei]
MTQIFAHRGASGNYPENTMLAFQEAERAGADGIELDVQLSKDGEAVVIHDEKLGRTTNGRGYVKDYTYTQLKKLNAAKLFGKSETIPSLEDVFCWMSGNELLCIIELKNTQFLYPGIEEKVISLIREYGMEERVILTSFNHYSMVYCHRLAPEVETSILYRDGLFMPWIYAKAIQAKSIHPNILAAPEVIILSSIEQGIQVRPYLINKESEMKRLFSIKCSAIITDYPKKAVSVRKNYHIM